MEDQRDNQPPISVESAATPTSLNTATPASTTEDLRTQNRKLKTRQTILLIALVALIVAIAASAFYSYTSNQKLEEQQAEQAKIQQELDQVKSTEVQKTIDDLTNENTRLKQQVAELEEQVDNLEAQVNQQHTTQPTPTPTTAPTATPTPTPTAPQNLTN